MFLGRCKRSASPRPGHFGAARFFSAAPLHLLVVVGTIMAYYELQKGNTTVCESHVIPGRVGRGRVFRWPLP